MGARGGRGLSVSAAMAARPGGGGGARPVPATAAAASLPAASRLPVRKAHAKRAAAAPEPEAPEQKRRRSGPRAGWAPSSRAPLRAISVPTAPGPGLLRKAMTVAAAPQAGKKAPGAASGSAAPPPVPGVRRRAAGDPRGQLAELREKIRGLEDDNRQLREQLQHSRAREEELEGQVSSLRTELQQSQEERSRWQREAQAAERQRLAAELQERHRQLEELREAARDREEQLGAAQAELRALAGAQEEHLHALEMERRRLHNQLQELKGNIRVFCRVRPLLAAEQEVQKGLEHLHFPPEDNKTLVLCRTEGSHTGRRGEVRYDFSFDRVFPPGASQEDVFEEIALLVQSALDGYPVCIFAYGQTGSGKTYTMEGPGGADPTSWGVIPRAVRHLFGGARQLEHKGWQYSFSASFLEIYNEALRDLLGGDRGGELEIRHVSSASKELHVPNLRCVPVASEDEVLGLLQTAASKRSVARTALNDRSSRSHCVFQLHIQGSNASRALRCSSVLSLVDLAGSERLDKCQASGQRLRETQAINSSLATLGLVIMAISNKELHVPYRNSKLTYLLQNSLRGNAKMLMFVNISPLEENLAESLNSLRFASKVNECMVGTAHANKK
ncbi:carboxy-terminal kinesin 2-like isoform X3 [Anas platyrhynchos]|uniref:carboxy-terminal kinesin 2-like isoform X3 n=1 Tax=Anas platyrhynchos TaxID=8839 RepID=UPI003AF3069F